MSDDALTTCPTTGQPVKRIISGGGGVVYKGSGWYVTDYKNGGNNGAPAAPKEETAGAETKSTATNDKSDS